MAVYQRSDVPFTGDIFTIGDIQAIISNNSQLLLSLALGGTITDPTLNLPDGSTLTLQGSFTVTLGFPVTSGSGTATGLVLANGGQTIATLSGISAAISFTYNA